MMLKMNSLNCR